MLESRAQFAARLGVNRSTVTRWMQSGKVVMRGHLVDVEASQARLQGAQGARPDVAERNAKARGHALPLAPATAAPAPAPAAPDTATEAAATDGAQRAHYRALLLQYENQSTRLAMALARGTRLTRADVAREATALGGTLRAQLERTIDQLAPRLTVADAALRARLLEQERRQLRRALSRALAASARALRPAQRRAPTE